MTSKLRINEMNTEQLRKVWEVNGDLGSPLQQAVADNLQDELMFYVEEIMSVLSEGLSSWSIGFCNRSQHITAHSDMRRFIDAVKEMHRTFCFMPDSYDEKVEELDSLIDRYHDMDIDNKRYDDLETKVEESIEEMEDDITRQFTEMLDGNLSLESDKEHFLGFYSDCRMEGDEYVIFENGETDWKLYQDVAYTKSFA